jgi:PAS domain S-box-containing protein
VELASIGGSRVNMVRQSLFYDIFRASPLGIAVEDLEGRLLFVNAALCAMFGVSEEELRRDHLVQFRPLDDRQEDWALFHKLREGAIDQYEIEKRYLRRNGSPMWSRLHISLVNSRPSPLVIAVVEDLVARRSSKDKLSAAVSECKRAEEARFRHAAIVESSVDAIISKDLNAIITSWNSGAERMFEYSESEAVGQPITLLIPLELRDEEDRILERLRSGGRIEHYETKRLAKTGKHVDVSLTIGPIRDSTGRLVGFSKIAHDITDRKRAEEAVKESEARYRAREELLKIFIKSVPAGVAMLDREMRYLQVSDRFCADYGVDGSAIIGRSHYDVFPDLPAQWKEVHRRALAGETVRAEEDRWDREHGTVWVQWEIRPWRNVEGVQGGILIFAVDISRHKQMEDALRDTTRKLVESQEQERTRIGRELHDDISQRLAMLTVEVDDLNDNFPVSESERKERFAKVRQRLVDISSGVESLSQQLYSPNLELIGMAAAMRGFCQDFAAGQKVEIQFDADKISRTPPPDVALCLLRVLQEALHNAAKHSRVRRFHVRLACSKSELDLRVSDRGSGFDLESAMKSGGLGLSSMQERVRLIHGTISIDSKPHGGTTIRVRAPLDSQPTRTVT